MQRIEAVMNRRIAAQANNPTQACMRQKDDRGFTRARPCTPVNRGHLS